MRKLTIKREKSFVGCLGTMKIYIEDQASSELTVNGVGCRKLGDLKNGEEKSFEIGCEAVRIFVIGDKLSKDTFYEVWQLEAGEEDVYLAGRNKYNPAAGNMFRFNGNANAETIAARKKGTKRGILILVLAFIGGIIIGLMPSVLDMLTPPTDKVFTDSGITITLTDDFQKVEMDGFEGCYGSTKVSVFVLKEQFDALQGLGELTLTDYAELVIETNGLENTEAFEKEGLVCFEYEADTGDGIYSYFATVHRGEDSFWMVQFATLKKNYDKYFDSFVKWAGSVKLEA